jgi:hypothetical protein
MSPKEKYLALVEECRQTHDMLVPWQMAAKLLGLDEGYVGHFVKIGKIPVVDSYFDVRRVKLSAVAEATARNPNTGATVTDGKAVDCRNIHRCADERPCTSPRKGEVANG